MKIWKLILATLVIFAAGIGTGTLITRIQEQERRPFFRERDGFSRGQGTNGFSGRTNHVPLTLPYTTKPPGRGMAKEFLDRLDRELKLEPEQHKRLETILSDSQKRSKELWEKIAPELKEEMKASREKMRDVLTPAQNKRLDELMKRPPKPPKDGQSTNSLPKPSSEAVSNSIAPPAEPTAKP